MASLDDPVAAGPSREFGGGRLVGGQVAPSKAGERRAGQTSAQTVFPDGGYGRTPQSAASAASAATMTRPRPPSSGTPDTTG
ncbi:hypothetical protein [Streptomyces sp. NPDC002889]|uniref:hypothetical protein n=1 Tax=Streptomyces sp. NPDC002889 TaxID=3364669 RepID=UPI0036B3E613